MGRGPGAAHTARRTHLSAVSWCFAEKSKKLPLACSAANSMEFSLGGENDGTLLSGWIEETHSQMARSVPGQAGALKELT